jgi:serine/threonine-protein kinase HipA
MKLSVIKNTGKGGGLTIPLGDEQGAYIAKFPSTLFPGVSENEYANLALAEAIGMVLERIDAHVKLMIPILGTCAD